MNGLLLWHCIIHIPWPTPMTAVVPMEPQQFFFLFRFFFSLYYRSSHRIVAFGLTIVNFLLSQLIFISFQYTVQYKLHLYIYSYITRQEKSRPSSYLYADNHHLPIITSYWYLLTRKFQLCLNNSDELSNTTCKSNQVSDISTKQNGGRSVTNRPCTAVAVSLLVGKFGRRVIDRGP